ATAAPPALPYTTLFRSQRHLAGAGDIARVGGDIRGQLAGGGEKQGAARARLARADGSGLGQGLDGDHADVAFRGGGGGGAGGLRSEEHTSELQSRENLV